VEGLSWSNLVSQKERSKGRYKALTVDYIVVALDVLI
jgi:hypothetical protein